MGIELPGWLTEPVSWVGMEWPQADETKLFEAGQTWINFATAVMPIGESANGAARNVWSTNDGPPAEAFKTWWTKDDGPTQRLTEDTVAAMVIGAACIIFAAVTLAMKIAWIVSLIILAYQVAMAIAAAFASFGASLATIPGFIAACRVVCMRLLRKVIDDVIKKAIKELLDKAKKLLKKADNLFKKMRKKGPGGKNKIPGPRSRDTPLDGQPLGKRYRGEADPNNPNRPFYPSTVRYMDDAEREAHRLFVRDGKLYSAKTGEPFDTTQAMTAHSGDGRAMYVMDRNGNLYARNEQEVGVWHHSSFLRGDDVAGAGEIRVSPDGTLEEMTRKSGHYRPEQHHQDQVLDELRGQGAELPPWFTSGSGF